MANQDQVTQEVETRCTEDWKNETTVPVKYNDHSDELLQLLSEFEDVRDGYLGRIETARYQIELTSNVIRPPHCALYHVGLIARHVAAKKIQKELQEEVIETASKERASSIFFVPKKYGSLRFFVDYCKLNAVTVTDSFPLQSMVECTDFSGGARIFSTIDGISGYWQNEFEERDRSKTAVTSSHGLSQLMRMPLGLKIARMTFQRATDVLPLSPKWQSALLYLDNIVFFRKNANMLMTQLRQVLALPADAGVTLKLKTCSFFAQRTNFLEHVVRLVRLKLCEVTAKAVQNLKTNPRHFAPSLRPKRTG